MSKLLEDFGELRKRVQQATEHPTSDIYVALRDMYGGDKDPESELAVVRFDGSDLQLLTNNPTAVQEAETVFRTVVETLGPKGQNIILEFFPPQNTPYIEGVLEHETAHARTAPNRAIAIEHAFAIPTLDPKPTIALINRTIINATGMSSEEKAQFSLAPRIPGRDDLIAAKIEISKVNGDAKKTLTSRFETAQLASQQRELVLKILSRTNDNQAVAIEETMTYYSIPATTEEREANTRRLQAGIQQAVGNKWDISATFLDTDSHVLRLVRRGS